MIPEHIGILYKGLKRVPFLIGIHVVEGEFYDLVGIVRDVRRHFVQLTRSPWLHRPVMLVADMLKGCVQSHSAVGLVVGRNPLAGCGLRKTDNPIQRFRRRILLNRCNA